MSPKRNFPKRSLHRSVKFHNLFLFPSSQGWSQSQISLIYIKWKNWQTAPQKDHQWVIPDDRDLGGLADTYFSDDPPHGGSPPTQFNTTVSFKLAGDRVHTHLLCIEEPTARPLISQSTTATIRHTLKISSIDLTWTFWEKCVINSLIEPTNKPPSKYNKLIRRETPHLIIEIYTIAVTVELVHQNVVCCPQYDRELNRSINNNINN